MKLPKLIKTKFDGTFLDRLYFWNKFESWINKSEVGPVNKFSYLKELLMPRNILLDKFGKSIEIAAVDIDCITSLLVIQVYIHSEYMSSMKS